MSATSAGRRSARALVQFRRGSQDPAAAVAAAVGAAEGVLRRTRLRRIGERRASRAGGGRGEYGAVGRQARSGWRRWWGFGGTIVVSISSWREASGVQ
jgi:hypothetical protein